MLKKRRTPHKLSTQVTYRTCLCIRSNPGPSAITSHNAKIGTLTVQNLRMCAVVMLALRLLQMKVAFQGLKETLYYLTTPKVQGIE